MACWLPSFCFEMPSAVHLQAVDGAAKNISKEDQKETLNIAVDDSETSAKTPRGSHASFPEVAPPLSPNLPKDVPRSFLCPITLDLMKDPVMLVETLQTYDRTSIRRWFDWGGVTCPVSGKQLLSQEVVNNPAVRSAISDWKESGWKVEKSTTRGESSKGQRSPSPRQVGKQQMAHLSLKPGEKNCRPLSETKGCNPTNHYSSAFILQNQIGGGFLGQQSLPRAMHTPPVMQLDSLNGHLEADLHPLQQQWQNMMIISRCIGIGATMANEIMQRRATVYESDHAGWTALHWAAKEDDSNVVQALIQLGASIQQPSTKEVFVEGVGVCAGANPLHVAAFFGSARAAQALVDSGADVGAYANSEMHQTAMHIAARLGHASVIEVLAKIGDVNARDYLMDTPLHLAALKGHLPAVEVLVQHGADVTSVNGRGKRASELVTDSCNYFEQFSNVSPLDEFRMMELLDQNPAIGISLN